MLVTMVHHSNSHDHGGDWDCRRQRVTHQLLKNEKISWQKHNGVASSDLCTRNCFIKSPSTTWSLSFNRDIKSPAFLFMASQWWLLGYGDGLNALCWVLNMGSGLRPRGPCQILENKMKSWWQKAQLKSLCVSYRLPGSRWISGFGGKGKWGVQC